MAGSWSTAAELAEAGEYAAGMPKHLAQGLGLAFAAVVPAQSPAPAAVAERLQAMSIEQKAGQLFMAWSLSRSEGEGEANNHRRMLRQVREAGLGGVILSLGTVDDAAALIPRLQAAAEVPLLLAGDFEGGVWFRLQGATELGNQMLVGATGSAALAEAMGRVTGREARALGFHWVFAPVLDVNSNPSNPIINVRSFGEDPQLVARLGRAFARGVRATGLISCGKHFPGHGDVATDSHLELPTVPGDGARLRSVELLPFAVASRDGLESIMTGHLAVPGLGEDPKLPATLSRRILGEVLRDEIGFEGLIVTDALEMGGVKNAFAPGEVAVRALLAGADVLLMPPDPLAARQQVIDAVRSGRVEMGRLDDAVRRILAMKQRVGLLSGGGRVATDWRQQLRGDDAVALARDIARRGPVLVRDDDGALDALQQPDAGALLITLVDQDEGQGGAFAAAMADLVAVDEGAALRLSGASSPSEIDNVVANVAMARHVVLSVFVKVREFSGGVSLPPRLQPVWDALDAEQKVTVASFGNPYLVRDLPHVDAYVAAFVATGHVQRAVAAALRGRTSFIGRLPVGIPGIAPAGFGLTRLAAALPTPARPEELGFDAGLAADIEALLQQAIAAGAFPGAVCVVARHGRIAATVAVGRETYAEDAPRVTAQTCYDLASLTKVCATTPAVLRLVAAGRLSLDDPVHKWVPGFRGRGKPRVTVRDLLAHRGGLPAYVRFFRSMQGRQAIIDAAVAEGLMSEPGASVRYSDLGFILLMAVVEAASGEAFDVFVRREVLAPFGMDRAMFAPMAGPPIAAAPTEHDSWRGEVVRGRVHDENAFAMGGVSGHAGLFATGRDVTRYGVALLAGGRGMLPRKLVAEATRPVGPAAGDSGRGLGYEMLRPGSWAGSEVSPGAFGHTGFTGTSLWCDPVLDVCVVLLTNRVHPTRVNSRIGAVRRDLHDLVRAALR